MKTNIKLLGIFFWFILSLMKTHAFIEKIEVFLADDGTKVFCFRNYCSKQSYEGRISEEESLINKEQVDDLCSMGDGLNAALVVENMKDYKGDNESVKLFVNKHFTLDRDVLLNLDTESYEPLVKNIEFRQPLEALDAYYIFLKHLRFMSEEVVSKASIDIESIASLNITIYDWFALVGKIIDKVSNYKDNDVLIPYYQKVAKETGEINNFLISHFRACDTERSKNDPDIDLRRSHNPSSFDMLFNQVKFLEDYNKVEPKITQGNLTGSKILNDYISSLVIARVLHQINKLKIKHKNIFVCVSFFQGKHIKKLLLKQGYKHIATSKADKKKRENSSYHTECGVFHYLDTKGSIIKFVPTIKDFIKYHGFL